MYATFHRTNPSEMFEDTKGVIRNHKSNDRQHNDHKEKDKQRSTKHYTKYRATRPHLKTLGEFKCSSMVSSDT